MFLMYDSLNLGLSINVMQKDKQKSFYIIEKNGIYVFLNARKKNFEASD